MSRILFYTLYPMALAGDLASWSLDILISFIIIYYINRQEVNNDSIYIQNKNTQIILRNYLKIYLLTKHLKGVKLNK